MRVQWRGDNQGEVDDLLSSHLARTIVEGDKLYISGIDGLHIEVELGDWVQVRGDSVGVQRTASSEGDRYVIWKGENVREVAEFIKEWPHISINVTGNQLFMRWDNEGAFINPGDRLLRKGNALFVSRAGKDHRA